jgi:hypothetical protein
VYRVACRLAVTRVPAPEEAALLLGEHGVVCRMGEFMPEDLMVEA